MGDPQTKPSCSRTVLAGLVVKAGLSDIAAVFNIVQDASAGHFFNSAYTQPRYQAGLALQLFSVCLLGKIRLPDGSWSRATLDVVRIDGGAAGFILIRHLDLAGTRREIYMCAVDLRFQRQGLGRQLIQWQLERLADGATLKAQCLPEARPMKRLLRNLGFEVYKAPSERLIAGAAQSYVFSASKT